MRRPTGLRTDSGDSLDMNRLRGAVGLVEIERLIGKLLAAFEVCSAASRSRATYEQADLLFGWRLSGSGSWNGSGLRG